MKLRILHETFNTGAIAMRPAAMGYKGSRSAPERSKSLVGDNDDSRWYLHYSKLPKTKLNEFNEMNTELKEAVGKKNLNKIEEVLSSMSNKMKEINVSSSS